MMFELLLDVIDRFLNVRDTDAECAISLLPSKVSEVSKGLMNPNRTPIIESLRTTARITPYPTGRLLGVTLSQALRARLRSHRPSGTFRNRI
jgi:hypothetical protein